MHNAFRMEESQLYCGTDTIYIDDDHDDDGVGYGNDDDHDHYYT